MTDQEAVVEPLPPVIKGKSDWREYRAFKLQNGVTCVVVNDRESKATAAACAVHCGAAADPREMSGLAHFCEHMCFLGSEKYPGENEYKKYLASHGGRSNASTSLHLTTYKFDVLAPFAEHAIDIFSNFFIAPLFTMSGTSREVQAVDSENSKNLTSDARRRLQIMKDIGDKDHYYTKFTTGNALTLPAESKETERIRAALLAFHRYHYQPENMTVAIVGPQSLDELQAWVVPRFGAIQSSKLENPQGDIEQLIINAAKDMPEYVYGKKIPEYAPAFSPKQQKGGWPVMLTVKPLQSMRKLVLNFPMPPVRHLFNSDPSHVLSHLLGHEGPGSSFALLQSAGLLTSLSAGCRISGPDQTLFQLDLSLTEHGEQEWKSVVALIFEHCRLIAKEQKNLQSHWDEMHTMSRIHFTYASPNHAYDFAPHIVESLVVHGTEFAQAAGWLTDGSIPDIKDFVACLTPQNCFLERCSDEAWKEMESIHDFPEDFGKKSEPWYGIEYYVTPVTDYAQWNAMGKTELLDPSQLHLPRPNRYIPRVLELAEELPPEAKQGPRIEKEIDPPNLLTWNRAGRLWHRLDDRYALPKSSLNFLIRNAAVEHSMIDGAWQFDPQASVHSTILGGIFLQAMAQDTYDADLAGLSWSLTCSTSGIRIQCGGYSDRLSDLALKVLQDFLDGDFIQESYYRATKDRILRNLQSYFSSRRADSHALHYQDLFFSSKQIEIDVSLSITENTTFHEIIAQHRRIVENAEIEIDCLYSGNVSETRAKDFFADASDLVNKARTEIEEEQVFIAGPEHRRLEYGRDVELHFASENEAEENGAVLMTYQSQVPGFRGPNLSSPESLMSSAAIRLVCHMLREPLFDVLRTKQQLGYIVSSYYDLEFAHTNDKVAPIDLITIVVLSRKVAPPEVVARIDEFLSDFKMSLINMPESEIRDHADALSTKLLKPIQKLVSETSTHFAKIRRYGPEILRSGGTGVDLPWDSVKDLAGAIRGLQRQDLVSAWDRVVLGPHRSRITSMVYGSTFPLDENLARKRASMKTRVFINDSKGLVKVREKLSVFDNSVPRGSPLMRLLPTSTPARIGIAAAAIGVIGFTIYSTTNRRKR